MRIEMKIYKFSARSWTQLRDGGEAVWFTQLQLAIHIIISFFLPKLLSLFQRASISTSPTVCYMTSVPNDLNQKHTPSIIDDSQQIQNSSSWDSLSTPVSLNSSRLCTTHTWTVVFRASKMYKICENREISRHLLNRCKANTFLHRNDIFLFGIESET